MYFIIFINIWIIKILSYFFFSSKLCSTILYYNRAINLIHYNFLESNSSLIIRAHDSYLVHPLFIAMNFLLFYSIKKLVFFVWWLFVIFSQFVYSFAICMLILIYMFVWNLFDFCNLFIFLRWWKVRIIHFSQLVCSWMGKIILLKYVIKFFWRVKDVGLCYLYFYKTYIYIYI